MCNIKGTERELLIDRFKTLHDITLMFDGLDTQAVVPNHMTNTPLTAT
jgi:hypothetical protein